jgi:hypothetical protein
MAGRVAYYGNIVRDGLILDLDAAKRDSYPGSGTSWRDIVGGVITGSLIGGPTFDPNNGGSIVFDGVDDYVSTNQSLTSLSFSYEVFLRPTNITKDQMYIGTTVPATYIRIVGSSAFMSVNTTSGQQTLSHSQTLSNNTPYHIVSIYNGVRLKIYVNGVLTEGSILNLPLEQPVATFRIGRWRDIDLRSFVGQIYTVRLYNRELSQSEVTQNYNATKTRFGL